MSPSNASNNPLLLELNENSMRFGTECIIDHICSEWIEPFFDEKLLQSTIDLQHSLGKQLQRNATRTIAEGHISAEQLLYGREMSNVTRTLIVDGTQGVGKSSLIHLLREELHGKYLIRHMNVGDELKFNRCVHVRVQIVGENVESDPILFKNYMRDKANYGEIFQIDMIEKKLHQKVTIEQEHMRGSLSPLELQRDIEDVQRAYAATAATSPASPSSAHQQGGSNCWSQIVTQGLIATEDRYEQLGVNHCGRTLAEIVYQMERANKYQSSNGLISKNILCQIMHGCKPVHAWENQFVMNQWQQQNGESSPPPPTSAVNMLHSFLNILVVDRSFVADAYVFCRPLYEQGIMGRKSWQRYLEKLEEICQEHPSLFDPDLLVYLHGSSKIALERIRSRNRPGEECYTHADVQRSENRYRALYGFPQEKPILYTTTTTPNNNSSTQLMPIQAVLQKRATAANQWKQVTSRKKHNKQGSSSGGGDNTRSPTGSEEEEKQSSLSSTLHALEDRLSTLKFFDSKHKLIVVNARASKAQLYVRMCSRVDQHLPPQLIYGDTDTIAIQEIMRLLSEPLVN